MISELKVGMAIKVVKRQQEYLELLRSVYWPCGQFSVRHLQNVVATPRAARIPVLPYLSIAQEKSGISKPVSTKRASQKDLQRN